MNVDVSLYLVEQAMALAEANSFSTENAAWFPDKWVAASAMQKGIRRGDHAVAVSAASFLAEIDVRMLRRRLAVTAVEDVGVGDPWLVGLTMFCCLRAGALPIHGRHQITMACVAALASSAKERSGDYLQTALKAHPELAGRIDQLQMCDLDELRDAMIGGDRDLIDRTIAAWLLAEIPSQEFKNFQDVAGDRQVFMFCLESLNIPVWMPFITATASPVLREPMVWTFPIKVDHLAGQSFQVQNVTLPAAVATEKVPHYALDCHTRMGKAALRKLLANCEELRGFLHNHVRAGSVQRTLEGALFTVEGGCINREIHYPGSADIKRLGQETDVCQHGLEPTAMPELLCLLRSQMGNLEDIRCDLLSKARKAERVGNA